jgi:hypothetical protein
VSGQWSCPSDSAPVLSLAPLDRGATISRMRAETGTDIVVGKEDDLITITGGECRGLWGVCVHTVTGILTAPSAPSYRFGVCRFRQGCDSVDRHSVWWTVLTTWNERMEKEKEKEGEGFKERIIALLPVGRLYRTTVSHFHIPSVAVDGDDRCHVESITSHVSTISTSRLLHRILHRPPPIAYSVLPSQDGGRCRGRPRPVAGSRHTCQAENADTHQARTC